VRALKTFDAPVLCSVLKQSMTNIDSAFDEKLFGFKSFTDFLKSIEFINITFDSKQKIHKVSLLSESEELTIPKGSLKEERQGLSTESQYRGFLRKKAWRSIPKDMLIEVYNNLVNLEPLTRSDLAERMVQQCNGKISATNIRKALSIFMKASLFKLSEQHNIGDQEKKWTIIQKNDFLLDVDKAIIERLFSSIDENNSTVYWSIVMNVLYSTYSEKELKKLISDTRDKENFKT